MHELQIPDELWKAHGGSREKMKTILWMAAMENGTGRKENVSIKVSGAPVTTKYPTTCPVCLSRIEEGAQAFMIDWEDGAKAIHKECAEKAS